MLLLFPSASFSFGWSKNIKKENERLFEEKKIRISFLVGFIARHHLHHFFASVDSTVISS
jgi:hypothetical protein